jgi:hypothetical protein
MNGGEGTPLSRNARFMQARARLSFICVRQIRERIDASIFPGAVDQAESVGSQVVRVGES